MESARVDNRERLPSDLQQVLTIARYDLYKHLRSRRLLGLLLIAGLILGLMYSLPLLLDQETSDDPVEYMTSYVGSVTLLLVLGATMFAGDAIVSEYQSRTGYLLFPQPVKRSVIYLGKYLSTVGIVSLMLLVFYCAAALLTVALFSGCETVDEDDYAGIRGNPPEYVRVYIDNVEYSMTPYDAADLDMTDGKVYRYSTNQLSVSQNHRYYFMAADGLDVTRLPAAAPPAGRAVGADRPPAAGAATPAVALPGAP